MTQTSDELRQKRQILERKQESLIEQAAAQPPEILSNEALVSLLEVGKEYLNVRKAEINAEREGTQMQLELGERQSQREFEYRLACLQSYERREKRIMIFSSASFIGAGLLTGYAVWTGHLELAFGLAGACIYGVANMASAFFERLRNEKKPNPPDEQPPE
jgi:hypothetical protein